MLEGLQEAADAMEAARGQLDELDGYIRTLSDIKPRMMQLDAAEVRATEGLTPEAYAVYHALLAQLEKVGGVQARAARMDALLFAHRADQVARVMREKGGRPDYTARDYFDGFVLRDGRRGETGSGFRQSSAARRLKEDMLAWKQKVDDFFAGKLPLRNNVVMRSPLVFDLIGADSSIPLAIDSKILQKLVDKHHFTRKELLRLPEKLADPLFVLRALGNNGVEDKQKRIVVIDMQIDGATVMVPFVMNTGQGFNKIASAYGREKASGVPNDQWYMNRLDQANLLYINKKRTDRWVAARTGAAGSHNAPLAIQSFNNISVPDETDLGKLKKVHPGFYQSSAQDMSAEQRLSRDEAAWNALIDRYIAADKNDWRKNENGTLFPVMDVPLVLQLLNIPYDNIHVFGSFFAHSVNQKHKGMTLDLLRQLPRRMADPLMVTRGNKKGSYVFVVDLKDSNGATIVVPVEIDKNVHSTGATVNIINTAFGKTVSDTDDSPSFEWIRMQFKRGTVLYLNKNKSIAWLQSYGSLFPAIVATNNALSAFIVSDAFQNVKTEADLEAARADNPGFYQRAWHGSPYDFDAFDVGAIGVGEGGQAHGWGLYAAQDRKVSEGYKERLKEHHKTLYTMMYDGKPIADASAEVQDALHLLESYAHDVERLGAAAVIATERKGHVRDKERWDEVVAEFDRPLALYEENPKVSVRALRASVPKFSNAGMAIDDAKPSEIGKRRTAADAVRALRSSRAVFEGYARKEEAAIRALDALDPEKVDLDVQRPVGKLFEVEVPDNDVLLDEGLPFDAQPNLVQEKLEALFHQAERDALLLAMAQQDSRFGEVHGDYCDLLDMEEVLSRTEDPSDWQKEEVKELRGRLERELERLLQGDSLERALLRSFRSGREIYKSVHAAFPFLRGDKAASLALNAVGIKGIAYDGRRDGRCFVIFDDKAIEIIEKFNQETRDALSSEMAAVRKRYERSPLWMMAPNGKPTNLSEEEWLAVRTPSFKAAFGDWEVLAAAAIPKIRVQNVQEAKDVLRALGNKPLKNEATGVVASVSKRGRGKLISSGARRLSEENGYTAEEHLLVAANVEQLFPHAVLSETHADRSGELVSVKLFSALVLLGKKPAVACFTVKETTNAGHKIYSVQMLELKKSAGTLPRSAVKRSSASADLSKISIAELADQFNPLLGRLDENGEPLPSALSSRRYQAQERAIYGEFAKEDGRRIITLFAGADPSTMLHEMGHLFLDDLDELAQFDEDSAKDLRAVNEWAEWHEGAAKEYEDTPWAEEFRAHEEEIRAALESGDALAVRAAKNRWRHERFARGFELYLYEGKAPSKALRGVFRRFRQLLARVYRFVKDVGGRPSPEVEAVMARMVASQEEIRAAELDARWRPVEKMGGKEALEGLLAFVRSPRALIRRAKKSVFMADRMNNMERDLRRDPHIFHPTFSVLEFLRDNAYRPLVFTDLALSIPTWNAAYERAFPEAMAKIQRENEVRQIGTDFSSEQGRALSCIQSQNGESAYAKKRPYSKTSGNTVFRMEQV